MQLMDVLWHIVRERLRQARSTPMRSSWSTSVLRVASVRVEGARPAPKLRLFEPFAASSRDMDALGARQLLPGYRVVRKKGPLWFALLVWRAPAHRVELAGRMRETSDAAC